MLKRALLYFFKSNFTALSVLSLSQIAPNKLSHDSISCWLTQTKCQPRDIWQAAKNQVLGKSSGIIVADETILSKKRSAKVELVRWQYSEAEHDV